MMIKSTYGLHRLAAMAVELPRNQGQTVVDRVDGKSLDVCVLVISVGIVTRSSPLAEHENEYNS